jgi:hypothetical protein
MSTPRCFPFRDILFVLNFIHLPVKVTGGQEGRSSITLGKRIFFVFFVFVMTITVKKNITNFGFTHIIKQLMTLDFS